MLVPVDITGHWAPGVSASFEMLAQFLSRELRARCWEAGHILHQKAVFPGSSGCG